MMHLSIMRVMVAVITIHVSLSGRAIRKSASRGGTSTWCLSLTGNGGNWASTLSFASEALVQFLDEVRPQKINLRCAVGASSGAASTVLVRTLLSNPSFGVASDGEASPEQARQVAQALSFLALTADLNIQEIAQTSAAILKQKLVNWGENAWEKSSTAIDVESTIMQFGRTIATAKHMTPEWFNQDVEEYLFWSSEKDMAKAYSVEHVLDAPRQYSSSSTRRRATKEYADEQLTKVMEEIAKDSRSMATKFLEDMDFSNGQSNGLSVDPAEENMVDKILAEKPDEGFITTVFVHPRSAVGDGARGLTYDQTRILALMSQATAEAILKSSKYQSDVSSCRSNPSSTEACRYLFGVVDSMRPMISLPTMEPSMVKPHVATLSDFAITHIYDPTKHQILTSASSDSELFLVVGGFVDSGQSVYLQEWYSHGQGLSSSYAFFGKDRENFFPLRAITKLLSPDASTAAAHCDHYSAWAAHRPQTTFIEGEMNWDCQASVPANLNGKSWRLRLHAIAIVREAMGRDDQQMWDALQGCEDQ